MTARPGQGKTPGPQGTFYSVWGSGPGDIFAGGNLGPMLLHRSDPEPPAQPDPIFAMFEDHSLWELTSAGWQNFLPPAPSSRSQLGHRRRPARTTSYAITADSHLWEHSAAGWAFLSAGHLHQVSATNLSGNAVVFAVLTDNSLWEYSSLNPGGWALLSPGGTILSVSAITDASGNDDVFAITADTHLWEHTPSGWMMLSVGSFQQISGLNGAGQAVVYGVLGPGATPACWGVQPGLQHWRRLAYVPGGTILEAAAAGPDQVFAITASGPNNLWQDTLASGGPRPPPARSHPSAARKTAARARCSRS